jgi:hypothetical protein
MKEAVNNNTIVDKVISRQTEMADLSVVMASGTTCLTTRTKVELAQELLV